jgi:Asp-tRNA(Asn)/Glu-tRNA(Gln) amidotransferase A subunit family amidase
LKPSDSRFAHKGRWISQGSPEIIPPVNGPLAKSVEDLALISEIWANESTKYDPESVPMPWKKDVKLPAKLKFGYFTDTDLLRVTPPVRRAMNDAVALLKAAGHEMVEVPMTDGTEFFTLAVQVSSSRWQLRSWSSLRLSSRSLLPTTPRCTRCWTSLEKLLLTAWSGSLIVASLP